MCSFSRLPTISKCCCFIRLRVSAYFIGLLQSLFGLGILIYAIASPSTEKQHDDHDVDADNSGIKL